MKEIYIFESDFGKIKIETEDNKLVLLSTNIKDDVHNSSENEFAKLVEKELKEYFSGIRKEFNIPLKLNGTEFQKKVWNELLKIPYGETRSYKYIAECAGNIKASRAVGNANNKNPIGIIVPCHRVIGKNGKLVGYASGLDMKEKLLELEKRNTNRRNT